MGCNCDGTCYNYSPGGGCSCDGECYGDYGCDLDVCACDGPCWKDNPTGCGCHETSYYLDK